MAANAVTVNIKTVDAVTANTMTVDITTVDSMTGERVSFDLATSSTEQGPPNRVYRTARLGKQPGHCNVSRRGPG